MDRIITNDFNQVVLRLRGPSLFAELYNRMHYHFYDNETVFVSFLNILRGIGYFERKFFFNQWTDLLQHVLSTYFPNWPYDNSEFKILSANLSKLVRLIRSDFVDEPGKVVLFCQKCASAMQGGMETLLGLVSDGDLLEWILERFQKVRFDGWGVRKTGLLMKTLPCRSENAARALIMFGFYYRFHLDYYHLLCFKLKELSRLRSIQEFVSMDASISESGNLRLQLIVEVLVSILIEPQFNGTFSLLWRAIPHEFITTGEMELLLKPFFREGDEALANICGMFAAHNSIFPATEIKQPRSLKHLSRLQVRENLFEAHNFSDHSIRSLGIPKTLWGYLKLNSFE